MIPSIVSRTCLATLVAWWGLMVLHAPWSAARAQEVTKPVAAKPEGESQAGETAVESGNGVGPYPIKGIGESPLTPVAPAIANAVADAVGVRIRELPLTSEKIYRALLDNTPG